MEKKIVLFQKKILKGKFIITSILFQDPYVSLKWVQFLGIKLK